MRSIWLIVLLWFGAPAFAQPDAAHWEQIRADAEAASDTPGQPAGVYVNGLERLHLSPDGHYTSQSISFCGLSGPMPIEVGRYRVWGDQLLLDPANIRVETEYDPFLGDDVARPRLMLPSDPSDTATRLVLLPLADGLRLVDVSQLAGVANAINYDGALPSWGIFQRVSELREEAGVESGPLSAADRARLPIALRSLLRDTLVEASASELLNADTLQWKAHESTLLLRLNRGERSGLFVGMDLHSAQPDAFFGKVESIDADSAVLKIELSRFHPSDSPDLPFVGQSFTSIQDNGMGCSGSGSFPATGLVSAVKGAPSSDLAWDDDGFAFVEVDVDVGARDGLIIGDTMSPLDGYAFEGRVTRVGPTTATVMLRTQRNNFGPDSDVPWPVVGDRLATPAWRYAARADDLDLIID